MLLSPFPYLIIFRDNPAAIEVIAIAHGRRAPGTGRTGSPCLEGYPPLADNLMSGADRDIYLHEADRALLSDDEYGDFQSRIAANPDLGALIRGGSGIRKVRVAIGSRGKSGGARVIYYWAVRKNVIVLLYACPKNVAADLTAKQVSQLAKAVKEEFGR